MHWKDILTPRDQAVLAASTWAKEAPFGLGAAPAVLVVDMYYGGLGLPRADILESIRTWPKSAGEDGWRAVDKTRLLLDVATDAGAPVVYFHTTPESFGHWNRKSSAKTSPTVADSQGVGPNDIVKELEPRQDDIVLQKIGPSGFYSTVLDDILRNRGCDTVLVCGGVTSGCVRATVVDACTRGYRVGVVDECCFDRFEASHLINLFDMEQKYADVLSLSEASSYLRASSGAPRHESAVNVAT